MYGNKAENDRVQNKKANRKEHIKEGMYKVTFCHKMDQCKERSKGSLTN